MVDLMFFKSVTKSIVVPYRRDSYCVIGKYILLILKITSIFYKKCNVNVVDDASVVPFKWFIKID